MDTFFVFQHSDRHVTGKISKRPHTFVVVQRSRAVLQTRRDPTSACQDQKMQPEQLGRQDICLAISKAMEAAKRESKTQPKLFVSLDKIVVVVAVVGCSEDFVQSQMPEIAVDVGGSVVAVVVVRVPKCMAGYGTHGITA